VARVSARAARAARGARRRFVADAAWSGHRPAL